MSTIFHEGRKILVTEIGNHNYAEIADFVFFRCQGSKYFDQNGQKFFLLPNINHIADATGFGQTCIKNALTHLTNNQFIKKIKIRCYDGAVRTKIYICERFQRLMNRIATLKTKKENAINDHTTKINREKIASHSNLQNVQNNCLDNQTRSTLSDQTPNALSYIKEQTKKEKNNNVTNAESKVIKEQSYQNNVSNVNSDLDFLKAYESPEYNQRCRSVIDLVAEDNKICNVTLGITILDLAEINIYQSAKKLVDDAITLTKRLHNRSYKHFPIADDKSLGKILKSSPTARMGELTPIQMLGVAKMLDYLEAKKGVYLTNRNEVFSWIEYQLTNPDHHFKGLSFRHALNVISKSLQARGALGYSKPYGYVA